MSTAIWVVVPAAGRGTRFGAPLPKQYLMAGGRMLLAHTLDALLAHPAIAGAMVAISEDDADWPGWSEWAGKPVLTCIGGATRAASCARTHCTASTPLRRGISMSTSR